MSIETNTSPVEHNERQPIFYPERPSYSAQRLLHEISKYQSGEKEQELLTVEEYLESIDFENPFVDELAKLCSISYGKKILYPEYFDIPEGQATLRELPGFTELYVDPEAQINIRKNISTLRDLDTETLGELGELSLKHHTKAMLETLSQHITEDGSLDIDGLDNPERIMFIKHPEELEKKIAGLRELKLKLEQARLTVSQIEVGTPDNSSTLIHFKLFRIRELIKKINVLLAEALEDQAILDAETDLQSHKPRYRLDKLRYGVGQMNSEGNYDHIDNRLLQQADEIAEEHIRLSQEKASILAEQGLDVKKMEAESVEPERIKIYLDRILSDYGLLSESPADAEQIAKNIKPEDNKWRCYIKPNQSVFEIDSKSKTLFIPMRQRSMIDVLTKGATHEIIHILQRENTAEIGLPLYTHPDQIAGDRAEMFQEGGAMYYQDLASRELFGFASPPGPHYIRAMAVKQAGGDYLACVKAYYESMISVNPKKSKSALKTALSSARRLFRNSINFNNTDNAIPSSKDTAYLEQKAVVAEILKYPELENLILVTGVNLETAKELLHFGKLDLSKLRTPDLSYVQKLWEEEKHNYTLDSKNQDQNTSLTPPSDLPLA